MPKNGVRSGNQWLLGFGGGTRGPTIKSIGPSGQSCASQKLEGEMGLMAKQGWCLYILIIHSTTECPM